MQQIARHHSRPSTSKGAPTTAVETHPRNPSKAVSSIPAGILVAALAFACGGQALAQQDAQPPSQGSALPPLTVTGTRIERPLPDTPAAVTVVDRDAIGASRPRLQMEESLRRVPGLFLQNSFNFAQGQRISARGFGSRAPFGVRGIRILTNGFPDTLPDGQSQVGAVDLDAATRVEVLRGASSAAFGNASGGVIAVTTANGRENPGTSLRLLGGDDGLFKVHASHGGASEAFDWHLSVSHLDFDGFREQSAVEKTLFNSRLGWQLDTGRRLEAFITVLHLPVAEDPGGLTLAQASEDREQAARFSTLLDAGQDVAQQRLGLRYSDEGIGPGELTVEGFFLRRDFAQQLPFPGPSLIAFDRLFFGGGAEYLLPLQVGGREIRLLAGFESQGQRDDRDRHRVGADGVVGDRTQKEDQNATVHAGFLQADIALLPALTLSLGGRYDRLRLAIDDRFLNDGDDSGARTFTEASGSAGIVWRYAGPHRAYASVSTAFEAPTFTEFARPDDGGGFNPDIAPQDTVNRELGLRNARGGLLHYDLTLFSVRVDDEITPFELDGRTFFQNAGKTERDGVELLLELQPHPALRLSGSYTWARYRFDRFVDQQGNDLSGNRLPGLPRQIAFVEAAWTDPTGIFVALDTQVVSHQFAENANALRVGGYTLVNFRGGYTRTVGSVAVEVFGGVNNLFDRDYFSNIRVNANADRPLENRGFFEPAPGRSFYAGLALRL